MDKTTKAFVIAASCVVIVYGATPIVAPILNSVLTLPEQVGKFFKERKIENDRMCKANYLHGVDELIKAKQPQPDWSGKTSITEEEFNEGVVKLRAELKKCKG